MADGLNGDALLKPRRSAGRIPLPYVVDQIFWMLGREGACPRRPSGPDEAADFYEAVARVLLLADVHPEMPGVCGVPSKAALRVGRAIAENRARKALANGS